MNRNDVINKLIEVDRIGPELNQADHLACMSKVVEDACHVSGISSAKTSVLGNRVWTSLFQPQSQLNYDAKVIRVFFSGRLQEQKNIHGIINALVLLRVDGWRIHLDVCGGRQENFYLQSCLSKLRRDEWKYHGSVANKRLPALYRYVDMYVGPSFFEGFQIPLIEALALGKPCVASNQPPANEIISEHTGALVEPEDDDSIADGILRVKKRLNDPSQGLLLRANCRSAALQHWDYFSVSLKEVNIYRQVLLDYSRK
jgi:glycosyltransferase involved in cell wall biosynthesis